MINIWINEVQTSIDALFGFRLILQSAKSGQRLTEAEWDDLTNNLIESGLGEYLLNHFDVDELKKAMVQKFCGLGLFYSPAFQYMAICLMELSQWVTFYLIGYLS